MDVPLTAGTGPRTPGTKPVYENEGENGDGFFRSNN
jgi:hypothetical protein